MIHVNELKFEGDSPWVKAMNRANDYWTKYCDETLPEKERHDNYEYWSQIRFEIESECMEIIPKI